MKISFIEYVRIYIYSFIEFLLFLFAAFFVSHNVLQTNQTIHYILGGFVFYLIIEINVISYKLDKLNNEIDKLNNETNIK